MIHFQKIKVGTEFEREAFEELLRGLEYQKTDFVAKPGEYAARGRTFDLYPLTYRLPVRLEFEMDRLVSIRDFSPSDGKSMASFDEVFLIPVREQFHKKISRAAESYADFEPLPQLKDLRPGDYVVHLKYGIGRFLGTKTIQVHGERRKHLALEYANREILYLETGEPVERFIGGEGRAPKLTKLHGKDEIIYGERTVSFKRPWKRLSFYQILQEKTGVDWRKGDIKKEAKRLKVEFAPEDEEVDILNAVFETAVEKELWDPTFVIDYPAILTPLAKPQDGDPELAYRFELYIGKMEIANAFSELNDPVIQREKLEKQVEIIGGKKKIDEDFLTALEYGMPPAGGLGIGIDRLVMILTNRASIREVILFPQLRPESRGEE